LELSELCFEVHEFFVFIESSRGVFRVFGREGVVESGVVVVEMFGEVLWVGGSFSFFFRVARESVQFIVDFGVFSWEGLRVSRDFVVFLEGVIVWEAGGFVFVFR